MTPNRSTEDLIRQLAASPAPRGLSPLALPGGMLGAMALALGAFWLVFGLRADLAAALALPQVQAKSVLPLALFGLAVWLARASARPGARLAVWPLVIPVGVGLLMVAQRVAGGAPGGSLLAEMLGQTAGACLVSITLLAALPLAAGLALLRRGAPTRPVLSGALLGLGSGAGIAAGYALHCTEDSPLFFMLWYGLAIAATTGLGAALGHRLLRW